MVVIGSSSADEEEEAKMNVKAGKDEEIVNKENSKDEKAHDHVTNDSNSKPDPAKDDSPQDLKTQPTKPEMDTSKDTKPTPPLIIYLSPSLTDWLPSSAIEDIKPDTNKGALEPKKDRFIEDDCCC